MLADRENVDHLRSTPKRRRFDDGRPLAVRLKY